MAFAAEWWRVGLAVGGGVVVLAVLWRVALADLVLSTVEMPTCERAGRARDESAARETVSALRRPHAVVQPNGNVPM